MQLRMLHKTCSTWKIACKLTGSIWVQDLKLRIHFSDRWKGGFFLYWLIFFTLFSIYIWIELGNHAKCVIHCDWTNIYLVDSLIQVSVLASDSKWRRSNDGKNQNLKRPPGLQKNPLQSLDCNLTPQIVYADFRSWEFTTSKGNFWRLTIKFWAAWQLTPLCLSTMASSCLTLSNEMFRSQNLIGTKYHFLTIVPSTLLVHHPATHKATYAQTTVSKRSNSWPMNLSHMPAYFKALKVDWNFVYN